MLRAGNPALALTEADNDTDSIAVQLLADIREIFLDRHSSFISSKDLVSHLTA